MVGGWWYITVQAKKANEIVELKFPFEESFGVAAYEWECGGSRNSFLTAARHKCEGGYYYPGIRPGEPERGREGGRVL